MRKLIIILFFSFCTSLIFAQENYPTQNFDTKVDVEINEDTTEELPPNGDFAGDVLGDTLIYFNEIELPADSINAWRRSKKYAWIKTLEKDLKKADSLEKLKNQRSAKKRPRFNPNTSAAESFFNSAGLKIFLWIIGFLFIGYIIYQLFLKKGFFSKSGSKLVSAVEEVKDDAEIDNDFSALQKQAMASGNTKLAVRYLFLQMLQKLNDRGHIVYVKNKTNINYVNEIPEGFKNDFSKLALYYEYIWYGNTAIDIEKYNQLANTYNQFINKI
jgi:hypothetical protein